MTAKFDARPESYLEADLHHHHITRTWKMPCGTSGPGHIYWEEGEDVFHVETCHPSDTSGVVVKLSPSQRVLIIDEECWVLLDESVAVAKTKVHSYLVHPLGLLIWCFTDAVWLTAKGPWYPDQQAYDELIFSEITDDGIAIGTGFNVPARQYREIKLDLMNQIVLQSAYSNLQPNLSTKSTLKSRLNRFYSKVIGWAKSKR